MPRDEQNRFTLSHGNSINQGLESEQTPYHIGFKESNDQIDSLPINYTSK